MPLDALIDLTSLGTLAAFTVCLWASSCCDAPGRTCRAASGCRCTRLVPLASVGFCLYLVASLPAATFAMFGAMLAAAVYTAYGLRHSRLERAPR